MKYSPEQDRVLTISQAFAQDLTAKCHDTTFIYLLEKEDSRMAILQTELCLARLDNHLLRRPESQWKMRACMTTRSYRGSPMEESAKSMRCTL